MFERLLLSLLVCTVLLEDSGFVQGQGNLLNSVLHRAILTKRSQTPDLQLLHQRAYSLNSCSRVAFLVEILWTIYLTCVYKPKWPKPGLAAFKCL